MSRGRAAVLADLRALIERLEHGGRPRDLLPFGVAPIDGHLGGGLRLGAVHEIADAGDHPVLSALFAAGILARLDGPVLWCLRRRDLFAPALACVGLHPDRVIYAEAPRKGDLLATVEEGLRHRGLAGVVGEVARLGPTLSRRLQLAAEKSGVTALVIRSGVPDDGPSAAATRWRIAAAPSRPLPAPGIGRERWRVG